jgi:hypothetical protein
MAFLRLEELVYICYYMLNFIKIYVGTNNRDVRAKSLRWDTLYNLFVSTWQVDM